MTTGKLAGNLTRPDGMRRQVRKSCGATTENGALPTGTTVPPGKNAAHPTGDVVIHSKNGAYHSAYGAAAGMSIAYRKKNIAPRKKSTAFLNKNSALPLEPIASPVENIAFPVKSIALPFERSGFLPGSTAGANRKTGDLKECSAAFNESSRFHKRKTGLPIENIAALIRLPAVPIRTARALISFSGDLDAIPLQFGRKSVQHCPQNPSHHCESAGTSVKSGCFQKFQRWKVGAVVHVRATKGHV
ncbi:MAG: hypothetical protein ABI217_08380 [Chthoniobacterales bacterium]